MAVTWTSASLVYNSQSPLSIMMIKEGGTDNLWPACSHRPTTQCAVIGRKHWIVHQVRKPSFSKNGSTECDPGVRFLRKALHTVGRRHQSEDRT